MNNEFPNPNVTGCIPPTPRHGRPVWERYCDGPKPQCGCSVPGYIKKQAPQCPITAVIPANQVDTLAGTKGMFGFVHVANINTTYYIDDQHRYLITWQGAVEADNYDYQNNPLGLRGQTVYDFANNRGVYYNKVGEYRLFTLSA